MPIGARPRLVLLVGAVALAAAAAIAAALLVARGEGGPGLRAAPLQARLDRLVARPGATPGAAAAVLTPAGSWSGAAGAADVRTGRALTPRDRFRIASITKTYVAAVTMQLVDEGRLRLDRRVATVLPGLLPPDKRAITIRHLLAHSSGLYDSMNDGVRALSTDAERFLASIHDLALRERIRRTAARYGTDRTTRFPASLWVDIALAQPLDFPPGEGNHYSNTNYVVLGWAIERVEGEPLGRVLARRLFRPLGLDDTFYVPGPDLPPPFARGYEPPDDGGPSWPVETTRITFGIAGSSSIVADADDVARFYRALFSGRVVAPRLLETMLVERMGVGLAPEPCGSAYGHDGGLPGYASWARASADGSRVAVLLVNGRGNRTDIPGREALGELFCAR
jgi:D-alanyl-D-alanine carboxypeptidase